MSNAATGRILLFILLIILQIALFDRIHLFGYATPLLYIYFIIKLPGTMNRNWVLLLAAFLGLCIDLFNHTMGMNMLACVVIGFFRYFFLDWFAPRDLYENYFPSFRSLGRAKFLRYAFVMTVLHHIILFTAESLSFFDPLALIYRIIGSVVLTILLIFAFESIDFDVSKK
ncbi:MAG: rod shape-determining protein MreD [Dysgonamonadaceae bacterium]|jgi:rod shape-determining protein MreD|nr:rod shape-determining protein MreD [Dysgonamonadaceae bacterium]